MVSREKVWLAPNPEVIRQREIGVKQSRIAEQYYLNRARTNGMRSLIEMANENGFREIAFREAARRHKVPAAVAMAADCGGVFLICTHGLPSPHAIFAIASMTKAITTTAAMQLVERGSLQLDEPVHTHLPELRGLPVLEDFDDAGNPRFSADRHQVTLRQLLTHTAGFAYNWNHPLVLRHGPGQPPFLVHRPGARWHYGTNIDWVGKLVEAAGGLSLEAYFQQHILQPLEMNDTSFLLPSQKLDRLVSTHQRGTDGALIEAPRAQPPAPPFFNGGGGLFSTAGDYIRFTQMILRRGLAANGMRILSEASILEMSSNQTNDLPVGRIRTTIPERSCNVDFHPGAIDRFGLGFLINPEPHHGGRSAGSLAWGGIRNTFYWVDPRRGIAAVLLMQFQPFCDPAAIGMLNDFERSVYQTL